MVADRDPAANKAAYAALISAAVMIAQQVGSKATRDALFLSSFEPEDLPRVVIAAAVVSMFAVLATSRSYARFGPARVVPFAFGVSAALYVGEWILAPMAPRPVAVVLYLHTAVFGALVVSGFWSVINERFDPHTAKKVVSRIGTGATFGGVAGGLLAERVGAWGHANTMLLALAILNAVAAVGVSRIGSTHHRPHTDDTTAGAMSVLRNAPYLRGLAAIVVLTAISAGLLDYAFKAEAAHHFEHGSDRLLSFFAIFHVVAAILSFLLQSGLAKPSLERLGVAGSVATLPVIVLLTAAASAGLTRLWTVVVARAAELVLANSIFRSGYELLYTPVAPERKRPTKALIDVAGNRIGDALGNGLVLVVLALAAPTLAIPVVLALAALVALGSLWVARRLHRGYVGQLEESLRNGTPEGASAAMLQAATLQTLSTLGLDREALFEQLAAHQSWGDQPTHSTGDGHEAENPKMLDGIDAPADDPVHEQAAALRDGDTAEIRAILGEPPLDVRLAPYAIALLARRDVHHEAIAALRGIATEALGPLTSALTDPDQPYAIRRRLPRVLEVCDQPAAIAGLDKALDDARFEVRYRAALALARIAARTDAVHIPLERVQARVREEFKDGPRIMDRRKLLDDDTDEDAPLLERGDRDRVNRSVEHVFTLLSLAYDPQPLRLSLVALASEDMQMRGTALEYLENVLPDDIRDALFPLLDARVEMRAKPARPRKELEADLIRSFQSMDAGALQRAIAAQSEPPPTED